MTSAAAQPHPGVPGRSDDSLEPTPTWSGDALAARRFGSPEQIRAALLPEQVAEFDAAFGAALTMARQTLRLDQLREVLRMWRRQALLTEQDPEAHRRMLATVAEVRRTGHPPPGSMPWSTLKAELGL